MPTTVNVDRKTLGRVTAGAAVGTVIEWYDFALYGIVAALVFNELFFPQLSPTAGTIAAFGSFAVGSVVRPLGGIVLGHLGDKHGRKSVLILALSLMGAATVLIGVLPTYDMIGIWAPVLLVTLRIVQGFGAGAELAGGITFIGEYAPSRWRGFFTSIACAQTTVGLMLATGAFALTSLVTSDAQFVAWGWRLPFLASVVVIAIAFFIRNRLTETPAFAAEASAEKAPRLPLLQVFKERGRDLVCGFLAISGLNATASIVDVYAAGYIVNDLGLSEDLATRALFLAALAGLLFTPLFGVLSDRLGRRAVMIGGSIFMVAFAYPFFALLQTREPGLIILSMVIAYGIGFASTYGPQGAFLVELFATRYRVTGVAIAREFNGVAVAGFTPLIASVLVAVAGGGAGYVVLFLAFWQIVSIVGLVLAKGAIAPTRRSGFSTADREQQMSLSYGDRAPV